MYSLSDLMTENQSTAEGGLLRTDCWLQFEAIKKIFLEKYFKIVFDVRVTFFVIIWNLENNYLQLHINCH